MSALLITCSLQVKAQVTSISEDFNSTCGGSILFPSTTGWTEQNHNILTGDSLAWHCTQNGRNATPAMSCSGFFLGTNHTDTAILVMPALDLTSYTGSLYLQFDTKTTFIYSGAKLNILESGTDTFTVVSTYANLTPTLSPAFSVADSIGWVTHQINITAYEAYTTSYFAFRYVDSSISVGSVWYIDNVFTTSIPLGVANVNKYLFPLTVIGNSTPESIKLSYNSAPDGEYEIVINDVLGKEVSRKNISVANGNTIFSINNINLLPGMYFIKMGNSEVYGYTKTIVQ
ncbi:MAG: choice-of-anchor J domain-containing protein [Bacteroidota bacterium]